MWSRKRKEHEKDFFLSLLPKLSFYYFHGSMNEQEVHYVDVPVKNNFLSFWHKFLLRNSFGIWQLPILGGINALGK